MLRPEDVAAETGYMIGRFVSDQNIAVVGQSYELPPKQRIGGIYGRKVPDIVALCAGKRPSFVGFDQAGYTVNGLFARAMAVAARVAAQGYQGGIHCYSDSIDNSEFDNPERCTVTLKENQLLTVRIRWGDEKLIGPLLDFCRAEQFSEEPGWEDWERSRKTA